MVRELRVLLYETPGDPFMNLAFEEALARARGAGLTPDTLRIWRNARAVVIGYFQRAEEEVDLAEAERLKVSVVRRFTGGGAVYHDLGNVNYALAVGLPSSDPEGYAYGYLLRGTLRALEKLGVGASVENVNDVVAAGRKVSGTAASFRWNCCFLHGTLLVDADLDALSRLLKPAVEKLSSRGISDVKRRVVNLSELLGVKPSYRRIVSALVEGFAELLGAEASFDLPLREELEAAELLYERKYRRVEWNLRRAPHSAFAGLEEEIRGVLRG
ncbi:MAG: biotin/lipoate A/B protein ligase family protein [Thermofilaceae archaeon]